MRNCMHKIETVKVTQGNAFRLLLPFKTARWENDELVPDNIDIRYLDDVVITIDDTVWTDYEMDERGPIVAIPEDMTIGAHNAEITATYAGVPIRGAFYECFTIVEWSFESNVEQHLPDSPLVAETSYVYIGITDDAELEALKQQLRNAIAATETARLQYEAAKQEFDEKAEDLDDVAQQSTLTGFITNAGVAFEGLEGNQMTLMSGVTGLEDKVGTSSDSAATATLFGKLAAVLAAFGNIPFDTITDLIGEATDTAIDPTVFGRLAAVLAAVGNIDFSTLAKQGSNAGATNTAILTAITTTPTLIEVTSQEITNMINTIISE